MLSDRIKRNLANAQRTVAMLRRLSACGVCRQWPYHADDCPVGRRLDELLPYRRQPMTEVWRWSVKSAEEEAR